MANEPENATLRLLRDIRAAQDKQGDVLAMHGGSLARLEKRLEDLYKISTHTLGVAVTAHERYETLEARVERLSERLDRLEAKQ
jgi:hypothetical protein